MLGDFLGWWSEQLTACVPARWRAAGAGRDHALVVTWREDAAAPALSIGVRRRGQMLSDETVPLHADAATGERLRGLLARSQGPRIQGARAVILRLPGRFLLERQVSLPLAAARAPERVIGYEMDRLTPFRADDLYWTCADPVPDRARGQVSVRLSMIARAAIRPMLDAMARLGLEPTGLEVPRPGGGDCAFALAPADPARQRRERRTLAALGGASAVLALAAVVIPFIQQAGVEADLDQRIAALRPRVAEVEALRKRIATEAASGDVVAAEQARTGDPLAALATLTTLLPDDSFLQDVSIAQRKLLLRGHSAAAARLIGALANDPAIRSPAFAAPVTRVENGQADIFTIRADWGP